MDNDYDRQRAFMRLTERERFERLYTMLMNMAANQAVYVKNLADARADLDIYKRALDGISHRKDDTLSTNEKIEQALSKQGIFLKWYAEKVLPSTVAAVQTIIVLAVLALAFGVKITP